MSSVGVAFAPLAVAVTTSAAPVTPDGFDHARIAITDADGSVTTIAVWIADTPDQRGRGLMDVTELGAADGMLFVFDTEAEWRFYMWHTLMPLSIAYFDASERVRRVGRDGAVHSEQRSSVRALLPRRAVPLRHRVASRRRRPARHRDRRPHRGAARVVVATRHDGSRHRTPLNPRRRRLLLTTKTLENAIAAPAIVGDSTPAIASGMAATL